MTHSPAKNAANWAFTPMLLLALVPKCPLCWPVYAAVFGALGLGSLLRPLWLLPLAGLGTGAIVARVALAARHNRRYAPLWVAIPAAALFFAGKYIFGLAPAGWIGAALLGGSLFMARPNGNQRRCGQHTL
jgi:hypothetical protein